MSQPLKIRSEYVRLSPVRDRFLQTARECSRLSLPCLVPPQGHPDGGALPTPYQGIGARGVNNLASKLLLALLPPNSPFFRLVVDPYELDKIAQDEKAKTALETALSKMEQAVMSEVETSGLRVDIFEALLHLITSGNALLFTDKNRVRVFHLDRYVVERDPMGNPLRIITLESLARSLLPKGIKAENPGTDNPNKPIDLYTIVERDGNLWKTWQEVLDQEVPGSRGSYQLDQSPYIPLRFSRADGEDYGRGLVEQYLGDLISLDGLSQALLEGSLAAAKCIFLVRPGSLTSAQKLAEARNGDFIPGVPDDVKAVQLEKFYDFRITLEQAGKIERRLETAFLLLNGVQRDAERVTAEEIRAIVQELEAGLGGVYSILSQELQLPLASAIMDRMGKEKRLPKLPKKIVKPTVVTGVEALGRGNDLQKLDAFLAGIAQVFGPEALSTYVNIDDYLARRAASLGISTKGLIKSQEEVTAAQQASQQQASLQGLAEKLGPSAIRELGAANQQQTAA